MNGVHDMGGMHGMGPIVREPNEPVFHHSWEGRVYAMTRALRARDGVWCLDAHRHGLEQIPPAEYLRMSYYERWMALLARTLVETGTATQSEIDTGQADAGRARVAPRLAAADVPFMVDLRPSARRHSPAAARFTPGERIRARQMHPSGHTRLPRYARGKTGVIVRDRGVYLFPDTHAHDGGDNPQHLYSVRFAARELWGSDASSKDAVYLDMWEAYLEQA
jgi:nitrile hydratase beta subunit